MPYHLGHDVSRQDAHCRSTTETNAPKRWNNIFHQEPVVYVLAITFILRLCRPYSLERDVYQSICFFFLVKTVPADTNVRLKCYV